MVISRNFIKPLSNVNPLYYLLILPLHHWELISRSSFKDTSLCSQIVVRVGQFHSADTIILMSFRLMCSLQGLLVLLFSQTPMQNQLLGWLSGVGTIICLLGPLASFLTARTKYSIQPRCTKFSNILFSNMLLHLFLMRKISYRTFSILCPYFILWGG